MINLYKTLHCYYINLKQLKNNSMKELIFNNSSKATPMVFKCKCGSMFVSNEYRDGNPLVVRGSTLSKRLMNDICPTCGDKCEGGRVYRPLLGSEQHDKWYGK